MLNAFGVLTKPVYCTKIASKLVRTYTDRHGLKNLLQELLDTDISKQQQSSYWGADALTDAQLEYAASDVLYLHKLKDELDLRLREREDLTWQNHALIFYLHVQNSIYPDGPRLIYLHIRLDKHLATYDIIYFRVINFLKIALPFLE